MVEFASQMHMTLYVQTKFVNHVRIHGARCNEHAMAMEWRCHGNVMEALSNARETI